MKVTAIVVAAGKGKRFGSGKDKPFIKLGKKPLLVHALMIFENSPFISDIVLVVDKPLLKKAAGLVKKYNIGKVKHIIKGGRERPQSVKNGLVYVPKDSRLVLVHDGVRPFLDEHLVGKVIRAANRFGAAILAHPVKPTIKISKNGSFVSYTPQRRNLWEAETPQVFKKAVIDRAYGRIGANKLFTDDSALVELLGINVKIVKGGYKNIKITTIEDLKAAEALIK